MKRIHKLFILLILALFLFGLSACDQVDVESICPRYDISYKTPDDSVVEIKNAEIIMWSSNYMKVKSDGFTYIIINDCIIAKENKK